MSNGISELQKGLIFRAPLSEWNPTRDEISGVVGTPTDVYNVLDRQGSGRRFLEFNGSSSYVTLPSVPAFGTGDFTVVMRIKLNSLGIIQGLIGGTTEFAFRLFVYSTNKVVVDDNSGVSITSTGSIILGENIIIYKKTGATGTFVINGNTETAVTDSHNYSASPSLLGRLYSGGFTLNGSISLVRVFNYALTPTQITNYSKPEYPIEASDRDGAGNLCVLDLNASGLAQAASGYWYDKTNTLTATNSGTSLVVPPASNLGATSFNGTTSSVDMGDVLIMPNTFTISVWIYPLTIDNYLPILSKSSGATTTSEFCIFYFANSKIGLWVWDAAGNTSYCYSTSVITVNRWNHVVVSFNSGIINFYINNIFGNGLVTNPINAIQNTTSTLSIGYIQKDGAYSNSLISNVQIWSRILSSDECKLVYDTNF